MYLKTEAHTSSPSRLQGDRDQPTVRRYVSAQLFEAEIRYGFENRAHTSRSPSCARWPTLNQKDWPALEGSQTLKVCVEDRL
jgi:hypothetical protein